MKETDSQVGQTADGANDGANSVDVTGSLQSAHQEAFERLCLAAKQGSLCLTYAFDRAEERLRPVISIMSESNGHVSILPIVPMIDDEPALRFLPVWPGAGPAH